MDGGDHGRRDDSGVFVDAAQFFAFTERMRDARERVDGAAATPGQRARWQERIAAIAETARRDLDRAEEQLTRLVSELDRSQERG